MLSSSSFPSFFSLPDSLFHFDGQLVGGRKLVPYLGTGLALFIVMSIVTLWYSTGQSRSELMQQLALPFVVALAAYDLVSFWIVDRKE